MTAALEPDWWSAQWVQAGRPQRLCVAFSGGRDSTVLLHSLSRMVAAMPMDSPEIRAIHINHGLQAGAADWVRHCEAQAARWSVPLQVREVAVCPDGNGLEDAARQARYSALMDQLTDDEWLLTAHHQRDQTETVLLHLLRGAGIRGLSAMPAVRERMGRRHWRPLLDVPAHTIERYAQDHALNWTNDPSNQDHRFRRNWLRNAILPQLRETYPNLDHQLAQTAGHMADAQHHLDTLADHWLGDLLKEDGCGLDLLGLACRSPDQQRLILRRWLENASPSSAQLQRLQEELIQAGPDRQPELSIGGWCIRRFDNALWRMPPLPALDLVTAERYKLQPGITQLPAGAGTLSIGGAGALMNGLSWSFAVGGERIRPHDQPHRRSLKQLHQTARVPPWIRQRTPLLWSDRELLSVGGYWNSAGFLDLQRQGLQFRWKHDLCAEPRPELRKPNPETA